MHLSAGDSIFDKTGNHDSGEERRVLEIMQMVQLRSGLYVTSVTVLGRSVINKLTTGRTALARCRSWKSKLGGNTQNSSILGKRQVLQPVYKSQNKYLENNNCRCIIPYQF